MEFRTYQLEVTPTGRIMAIEIAGFKDSGDALTYAKTYAAKAKVNVMLVNTKTGAVSIYAPFA